jgi:hypothetical protein
MGVDSPYRITYKDYIEKHKEDNKMTNRQIRRYNAANRQGYTMTQTVFFHLAMGALAGLIPFAIALFLTW